MSWLPIVLVMLGLAVPAYAGDVTENDNYYDAVHNSTEGVTAAAQSIAAQSAAPVRTVALSASSQEDGISNAAMELASQGTASALPDANYARDLRCLAEGIYFEARGEPWRGQLAVGRVILNRVASSQYPDTICGVVYQNAERHNRCQFSFACDGKADDINNHPVWYRVRGFASWLLANKPNQTKESEYRVLASLQTATHYHADYVNPRWAQFFELTTRIGRHIFYSDPSA